MVRLDWPLLAFCWLMTLYGGSTVSVNSIVLFRMFGGGKNCKIVAVPIECVFIKICGPAPVQNLYVGFRWWTLFCDGILTPLKFRWFDVTAYGVPFDMIIFVLSIMVFYFTLLYVFILFFYAFVRFSLDVIAILGKYLNRITILCVCCVVFLLRSALTPNLCVYFVLVCFYYGCCCCFIIFICKFHVYVGV